MAPSLGQHFNDGNGSDDDGDGGDDDGDTASDRLCESLPRTRSSHTSSHTLIHFTLVTTTAGRNTAFLILEKETEAQKG